MFGKNSKPLDFLIIIFNKMCLPVSNNTPVTNIVFAGVIGDDHFGFDVGFEADPGVLPDDIDFLAGGRAVEVDYVVLIAKGQGNKVRAAGFGV